MVAHSAWVSGRDDVIYYKTPSVANRSFLPTAMSQTIPILFALTVLFIALPHAHAFGAGDIPDFAYLNEKAFRHGDIENILESLVKYAGHASASGGLLGFASHVIKKASGGSKFSKSDIKKVYFVSVCRTGLTFH